jgi:hypothetical protein
MSKSSDFHVSDVFFGVFERKHACLWKYDTVRGFHTGFYMYSAPQLSPGSPRRFVFGSRTSDEIPDKAVTADPSSN